MTDTTFTDDEGAVRFSGKIRMGGTAGQVATVQANGTLAPAPGGGTAAQEFVTGGVAAVADGASGLFTLAHDTGAALLDYTAPTLPVFVADGTYIATVGVALTNVAAPGYGSVDLGMGPASVSGVPAAASPILPITLCVIAAAGDVLGLNLFNHNGDASTMDAAIIGDLVLVKL